MFGKNSKGTIENVRIHVEKAAYVGTQAPLFDNAILAGSLKNVFITFGASVAFNGSVNGLISSVVETVVKFENVYAVGTYTCLNGNILTWAKNATHNTRFKNAMNAGNGAYFTSLADFKAGTATVDGVKQDAVDYKAKIASAYDSAIWDLSGDYPELKKPSK